MKHLTKFIADRIGLSVFPVRSPEEHLTAAAQWILRAQAASADDGVPHSYDIRAGKWLPSYPETTGYIIPTLYDYAVHFNSPECAAAAWRMAVWEADIQMADGGVRAGHMGAEVVAPTVFNTGQVLFGWARAFVETRDPRIGSALRRGADWLVAAMDEDGAWRRFSSPFTSAKLNSYNTRSAFGLVRASEALGEQRYLDAARRNVEWTLGRALPNGWLPDNCLDAHADDRALTHTIAYSIRGIMEVAAASGHSSWMDQAFVLARRVAERQRADGALPAYYGPQWQALVNWSCVTGNSQMALNWQRLARITGDRSLLRHAERANRFNMSIQDLNTPDLKLRGALKGSHPIDGGYMTYRYPNWATKFFMDALMLEILGDKVTNIG
jgi:hypothetical protein